jgi:hypothetical protein
MAYTEGFFKALLFRRTPAPMPAGPPNWAERRIKERGEESIRKILAISKQILYNAL